MLAVCVNLSHGDQNDKDTIGQIAKLKIRIKQQQFYCDCIRLDKHKTQPKNSRHFLEINIFLLTLRELIKLNATNFETLIHLAFRNEIIYQHNLPPQQAQIAPKNLNNNLNLLQTAFLVDGPNASKVKNI
jgi:hypothetical protein